MKEFARIMSDVTKNDSGAGVIIASDNISQRQAIAMAVNQGLSAAGFTNVAIHVDKSDDPTRVDVTPENTETLLGSMRQLNPQLFDAPIAVIATAGGVAALDLVTDMIDDAKRELGTTEDVSLTDAIRISKTPDATVIIH
jgi:hypothetical protein